MLSVFDIAKDQIKPNKDIKNSKKQEFIRTLDIWKLTNDKKAALRLLLHLKPTIDSALKSFAPGQLTSLRIQAAKIALNSLKSFDVSKNILPSTYVFTNLQRLNRLRKLRLNIIHTPEHSIYKLNIINNKIALLQDLLGRLPSTALLADTVGMSLAKLTKLLLTNSKVVNDSSAVSSITGQSLISKKDLTDDDYIKYAYSSINPIDQKILLWSVGLYGKPVLSNKLIAQKLKISPGAVSQRRLKIQQVLSDLRGIL